MKGYDAPSGCLLAVWAGAILLGLAFWGAVAWAIITLVNYVTAG